VRARLGEGKLILQLRAPAGQIAIGH
jgi:hypothetical protein